MFTVDVNIESDLPFWILDTNGRFNGMKFYDKQDAADRVEKLNSTLAHVIYNKAN